MGHSLESPQIHLDVLATAEYLGRDEVVSRRCLDVVCALVPSASPSINYPQSDTDDVVPRIYILLTFILPIGYTAHSASVGLHQDEMDAYVLSHKVSKLFKGRKDLCWLLKASISFKIYGTHGIFQSSGLLTLTSPSSSFACSMSTLFLPLWKSSSWEWVLTSLENILPVSQSESLVRMDRTSTTFLFLHSRSDTLSRRQLHSAFLSPETFLSVFPMLYRHQVRNWHQR